MARALVACLCLSLMCVHMGMYGGVVETITLHDPPIHNSHLHTVKSTNIHKIRTCMFKYAERSHAHILRVRASRAMGCLFPRKTGVHGRGQNK